MKSNNTTKDFTSGNIYMQMLELSIPLILGNILQQFYNTIDAFVVGRYAGADEFAAIGIAGTIMNLFLFMIVGACTGMSVLFSKYYGQKNYNMLHIQHFTSLASGLIFSIFLGLAGLSLMKIIINILQTPDNLKEYTCTYLFWIFISLPAAFLYNMYAAALRSCGDTVTALIILAVSVFCNLVLDIALIKYLNMGIKGAAIATAFTQMLSSILCIIYLLHSHKEFLFSHKECTINKQYLTNTLSISAATALHQTGLYIGKALVQGVVNTGGTSVISAYTAATRIEGFANSFGDSGSAATSVITAQSYGAGKTKRAQKVFITSIKCTAILGIICAVILFFSAHLTTGLMLTGSDSNAVNNATIYLKIIALFYPLCFTGGSFTGYFNGCGKVLITLAGSLLQISIRVILSFILFSNLGLYCVALATGIGWLTVNIVWSIIKKIIEKRRGCFLAVLPHFLCNFFNKF